MHNKNTSLFLNKFGVETLRGLKVKYKKILFLLLFLSPLAQANCDRNVINSWSNEINETLDFQAHSLKNNLIEFEVSLDMKHSVSCNLQKFCKLFIAPPHADAKPAILKVGENSCSIHLFTLSRDHRSPAEQTILERSQANAYEFLQSLQYEDYLVELINPEKEIDFSEFGTEFKFKK